MNRFERNQGGEWRGQSERFGRDAELERGGRGEAGYGREQASREWGPEGMRGRGGWEREGMQGRGGWERDEGRFGEERWDREQSWGRGGEEDRWGRMGGQDRFGGEDRDRPYGQQQQQGMGGGYGGRFRGEHERWERPYGQHSSSPYGGSQYEPRGMGGAIGQRWEHERDYGRFGQGGIGSEFPGGIGRQWGQGQQYGGGQQGYYGQERFGGQGPFRAQGQFGGPPYGQESRYDQGRFGQQGSFGSQYGQGGMRTQRRGPKNYTRSDERIREDICDRLSDRDEIEVGEVMVRVQNGDVILEGTVDERHHKFLIEQVADAVAGVKDVTNQLRVKRNEAITDTTRQNGGRTEKQESQQPQHQQTRR